MVVIAALVGAGGLGVPVVRALNSVQVGMGFEAGFAIVLLAIILDRISRPKERGGVAMSAAVEFQNVDILFARQPAARAQRASGEALAALDAGGTRADIQTQVRRHRRRRRREPERRARRDLGADGPVGIRQIDAAARRQRPQPGDPRPRAGARRRLATSTSPPATRAQLRRVRRERVAMVFQQFGLLPWRTVRENVGLRARAARRERGRARSRSSTRSSSWSACRNGRSATSSELSGGMQQRVGLARAFATDADILLMDEPFSALDPLIRGKLQDELLALQERVKKTILFVSHDLDEALRLGDRISILQNGRIIQTGTAEDIVLAPADDYVAEFVRHMNPLDVLTGAMIMCGRERMASEDGGVCGSMSAAATGLSLDAEQQAARPAPRRHRARLRHVADDSAGEAALADAGHRAGVVPASFSLQAIIRLRQATGHPVLLADGGRIVGVCGETEIIRALAGSRH